MTSKQATTSKQVPSNLGTTTVVDWFGEELKEPERLIQNKSKVTKLIEEERKQTGEDIDLENAPSE